MKNPRSMARSRPHPGRRSGQTLLFLLMILVLLVFGVLFVFDVHKTLFVKTRAQNAGDSAALAGARWQGIALNLIGELNALQALAISDALARNEVVFPEADAMADLAGRLAFVGPMIGLTAAQQAAKQNGIPANPDFTQWMREHGQSVLRDYPGWFPPPFGSAGDPQGAWAEYGEMILAVAASGVAAAPAIPGYGYVRLIPGSFHLLTNPSFYTAILGQTWCWFYFNAGSELQSYQSWRDWPPLPLTRSGQPLNSEFFSLELIRASLFDRIPGLNSNEQDDLLDLLGNSAGRRVNPAVRDIPATWFCYDPARWRTWSDVLPEGFPFTRPIRSEYDLSGADAVTRIQTPASRTTPGAAQPTISWTAAAKPFGALDGPLPAHRFGMVLPAFTDTRLIPVSASSDTGDSSVQWAAHLYNHLPRYLALGLDGLDGACPYCVALRIWEGAEFRAAGLMWLSTHSSECDQAGPGPGPGGGTRIGH
jgi:hypothetical protein